MDNNDMELINRSKFPKAEISIFPTMTALANKHNAINLAQGFPGFGADPHLLELISAAMKEGKNQYAPLTGVVALKEMLSEQIEDRGGRCYDPIDEITITAGATQALNSVFSSIVFPGDEVIVLEPAYDCYVPSIELNGGITVRSSLKKETYEVDWSDVKRKVNARTKAIVVNTPHNPTGTIWKQKDIEELKNIVRNTNVIIVSDEVYEHIVFDDHKHLSICNEPQLAERAFVIYSFGKTYHLTGWRAGYVVAPKELMSEFVKCHQSQIYSVNTPVQHALAIYGENSNVHLELNQFFQAKRDFFLKCIKGSAFTPIVPQGTYFCLLDYSSITKAKDVDFARRLTIESKVAAIPISVFFKEKRQDQVLRFCFAKNNDVLEKAAERLKSI